MWLSGLDADRAKLKYRKSQRTPIALPTTNAQPEAGLSHTFPDPENISSSRKGQAYFPSSESRVIQTDTPSPVH